MTTLVIILLSVTVIFCLYSLIVSSVRPLLTFLLIPLMIASCFFTWKAINYYKGYPIVTVPDYEVQVVSVTVAKPWVYLLLIEPEHTTPRYYVIPYTKQNEREFNGVKKMVENGVVIKGILQHSQNHDDYELKQNIQKLPPKQPDAIP